VLTDPVFGAYGSEFWTSLRLTNKQSGQEARVYGLEPVCNLSACIGFNLFDQYLPITTFIDDTQTTIHYYGTPGWFLYVPKTEVESLAAYLRVYDVTRAALNHGTEVPIVRSSEFIENRIVLTGVPTDPRFRNALRIYSQSDIDVVVTVEGRAPVTLALTGATDIFHPGYAIFTDFPTGNGSVTVTIDVVHGPVESLVSDAIWAFITVTNNETQLISTITPQP
jgi:hypothetical protein